jgi:hypothetical protein
MESMARRAAPVCSRGTPSCQRSAVRAEHPFVSWEHEKIRVQPLHVDWQDAGVMRRVDHQRCTGYARRRADAVQIYQAAIRPVHRRDRRPAGRGAPGRAMAASTARV